MSHLIGAAQRTHICPFLRCKLWLAFALQPPLRALQGVTEHPLCNRLTWRDLRLGVFAAQSTSSPMSHNTRPLLCDTLHPVANVALVVSTRLCTANPAQPLVQCTPCASTFALQPLFV